MFSLCSIKEAHISKWSLASAASVGARARCFALALFPINISYVQAKSTGTNPLVHTKGRRSFLRLPYLARHSEPRQWFCNEKVVMAILSFLSFPPAISILPLTVLTSLKKKKQGVLSQSVLSFHTTLTNTREDLSLYTTSILIRHACVVLQN